MQIIGHIFNKIVYYLIFRRKILIIDIFSAEKQVALGMGDHGTARKYTEKRDTSQTEQQTGTDASDLCLLKYL